MMTFFDRLDKHGRYGCWEFAGWKNDDGYGRTTLGKRRPLAHRLAYEMAIGPIPEGLEIDHLCRNRACCNPDHLEPVDRHTNIRRSDAGKPQLARTECPHGHAYTEANTYIAPNGSRHCKACNQFYVARYQARKRAEREG